jgi:hypothetical protein
MRPSLVASLHHIKELRIIRARADPCWKFMMAAININRQKEECLLFSGESRIAPNWPWVGLGGKKHPRTTRAAFAWLFLALPPYMCNRELQTPSIRPVRQKSQNQKYSCMPIKVQKDFFGTVTSRALPECSVHCYFCNLMHSANVIPASMLKFTLSRKILPRSNLLRPQICQWSPIEPHALA